MYFFIKNFHLELYTINDEEFVGRMFIQLIPARLITLYGNRIYSKISLLPSEIINEIQKKVSFKIWID